MRKSYIKNKKVNVKNSPFNKGTFFVHKKEKSVQPAKLNQSIIRASTILNSSTIFGLNKTKSKSKTNFCYYSEWHSDSLTF